jgi:DNA polymerase elongation subunit (family B)
MLDQSFRLFDFNVYNEKRDEEDSSDSDAKSKKGKKTFKDKAKFMIQMFGINEKGETCSILAEEFKPFFYVKVDDSWTQSLKEQFLAVIKAKVGPYYENSIVECKLIKRKKLYGFDGGKEHKFLCFYFNNMPTFNKVKNLWYHPRTHKLLVNGYSFKDTQLFLYESNIPPLLRFFHIKDISPSGWILIPMKKVTSLTVKTTTCKYEFRIHYKDIIPLNEKEVRVPYKICSFDIEASSSHGDFPIPVKSYKKLATNIVDYFDDGVTRSEDDLKESLTYILLAAYGYTVPDDKVELVFPIKKPKDKAALETLIDTWLNTELSINESEFQNQTTIEAMFERMTEKPDEPGEDLYHTNCYKNSNDDEDKDKDEYKSTSYKKPVKPAVKKRVISDILNKSSLTREAKITEINASLNAIFPKLEGDKVTFIGSTFLKSGEQEPYLNHCAVLGTCDKVSNAEIQLCKSEKDLLLAWRDIIQRENPDIIIGYNIFGFDYKFMFCRAEETDCVEEFLKLSRNRDEICGTICQETGRYKIEESSLAIASGQYDLNFIKIPGRLQIDLLNHFRREENLVSYKLDYVAGHFIGDYVKSLVKPEEGSNTTQICSTNLTGLQVGSYIHIEEIGHTTEYYQDGQKFKVLSLEKQAGTFVIQGSINPDFSKKVRWTMAKDDVTPKDIFRMTNGSDEDRAVIAKYCIQDCNLVHYLTNKVDVMTGFVEMAKICSVPINFLVMRGQGIKLTSYVAKKCREKRTLMPVIEKLEGDQDGYEGAIVLDPKCDLYLDNPVACVDYASLYPSSMMSENLSHDSKVWTREYDLDGVLLKELGEKNEDTGDFVYDNLKDYEYVDITYDTFKYVRKTPSAAAVKVKCGYKICRFAQYPEGSRAIMPSILEELLKARKTTRKLIPQQSDEFMKNVLDKRQLAYKLTANSLYGQCGARTSTFYEKDVAAATTATGRLLLTYAKKVIEETYGDSMCETSKGPVLTKAEYIYGDTDSVFFTFNLHTPEGVPIKGKDALEITIELAQEAGHLASSFLKAPHDLEYEKTFMPFCLLSKKRYVGMLYEHDPNKGKRKEMGIVLKRRDNAPIVKDIYGGIIDILMKQQDIMKAVEFLQTSLQDMVEEKYPMEKLVITKSLRTGYKNPKQIAHKVLADRITARDPGSKPASGDRIPFVYIHNPSKTALQGEKIETPTYIKENNIKIDYSFYITNQIMKPVQQVFALVLEKIWTIQGKSSGNRPTNTFSKKIQTLTKNTAPEKLADKIESLRNKEVETMLFKKYLDITQHKKNNTTQISNFYKPLLK